MSETGKRLFPSIRSGEKTILMPSKNTDRKTDGKVINKKLSGNMEWKPDGLTNKCKSKKAHAQPVLSNLNGAIRKRLRMLITVTKQAMCEAFSATAVTAFSGFAKTNQSFSQNLHGI